MAHRPLLGIALAVFNATTSMAGHHVDASPSITGQPPPALAPYAPNDPIPKLKLVPHERQKTAQQAAETFLAYLSEGLNTSVGPTLSGDPAGYDKAWSLLAANKPSLPQFKAAWAQTVRLGVIQLEAINQNSFFVELHRLHYCGDHWVSSFYHGEISALNTGEGWLIKQFRTEPEDLVSINLFGHQSWRHDAEAVARVYGAIPIEWGLHSLHFVGRKAVSSFRDSQTGAVRVIVLVRVQEGSWIALQSR